VKVLLFLDVGGSMDWHVERAEELDTDGYLRLWPHRHGTDGFFIASLLRKD